MINNLKYDKLFDDLVVLPDEQDINKYILKNKLDETDAIVIGTIQWKEDNFYLTLKEYIDLEAEYLIGIAEYMEGLEYVALPQPDQPDPAEVVDSSGNTLDMLGAMMGGMMSPIEGEIVEDAAAAQPIEIEGEKINEENN